MNAALCYQLQMETLQSRLDADFLLAHMCSVKFKEWIVVLATLLRRSEVCLGSQLKQFYVSLLAKKKSITFKFRSLSS
jgi:hypothetical protein